MNDTHISSQEGELKSSDNVFAPEIKLSDVVRGKKLNMDDVMNRLEDLDEKMTKEFKQVKKLIKKSHQRGCENKKKKNRKKSKNGDVLYKHHSYMDTNRNNFYRDFPSYNIAINGDDINIADLVDRKFTISFEVSDDHNYLEITTEVIKINE